MIWSLVLASLFGALSATATSPAVGHLVVEDATDATAAAVAAFEARLPRTSLQRARGELGHSHVGPSRRSLTSRAEALTATRALLDAHNAEHAAGRRSFFLAWNGLSDLSDDEYRDFLRSRPDDGRVRRLHSVYTRLDPTKGFHLAKKNMTLTFGDEAKWESAATTGGLWTGSQGDTGPLPRQWDWREIEGGKYLAPIKNQGTCGSCWAFSAVSVIESRYAIQQKVSATPLSVEQVLSCSAPLDHIQSKFPNMAASSKGCEGGMPFLAFEYMSRVHPNGITCASKYPYVMATKAGETACAAVEDSDVAVAWRKDESDYAAIVPQNEEALMRAVHEGPVSANMDATGDGFRHYGGGIYDASDCKSDGLDVNHAVVIVGYGETDNGDKYWVIRNTWGTMWGENGYMRVTRGQKVGVNGPCNLYLFSTYPTKLFRGNMADAVCPSPVVDYHALGWQGLLGIELSDWVVVICASLSCVIIGMGYFGVTEVVYARKDKAGETTYNDCYDRWVLPTKEQLAAVVARRQQQTASV